MIKILFIGDISGVMGKLAIESELGKIREQQNIDYVIANAENTTKGRGLDWKDYKMLCDNGVDFITMGNHTWHKKEIFDILRTKKNIIRPANLKPLFEESKVGVGTTVVKIKNRTFRITNLLGLSVTVKDMQTNPFIELQNIIDNETRTDFHIVDFHCETTSEKNAFFINFQGEVSAILGTHTHVQTNDAKIINNTAYITDVGMTGAANGVIGAKPDSIIYMFKGMSEFFRLEEQVGQYQFCAVILTFDESRNRVKKIEKVFLLQDLNKK